MAGRFGYEIDGYRFVPEEFLPARICDRIVDVRVSRPDLVKKAAQSRRRRRTLTRDGKLTILATDHPARMVTRVGDDPVAIGDRYGLLARLARVLTDPRFDGVMATPDIVEELLVLDYLLQEAGGPSFLDEKVILGCMNRGGLAGVSFEMDDVATGLKLKARYDKPDTIQRVSAALASEVDLAEAYEVGRHAVRCAVAGITDKMVTIIRKPGPRYEVEMSTADLDVVANEEKLVPGEFINEAGNDVTREFIDYASPLIGGPLPSYVRLERIPAEA